MLRLLTILLLLYTPFALGQREIYTGFEVRIVNPTGFIAPGESVQIFVEISNPLESGSVLESISGGGSSGLMSSHSGSAGFVNFQQVSSSFQRSDLCPEFSPSICAYESSFPLLPGETMTLAYDLIEPVEDLALGTALGKSRIHFYANVDGESRVIYSNNNLVYILSADGTGSESAFDDYQIDLPPIVVPELEVSYLYPNAVSAGSHFSMLASVRNTSSATVFDVRRDFSSPFGIEGIEPLRFNRCDYACLFVGTNGLAPGESIYLDIGQFFYIGEILQSASVEMDSFAFSLTDAQGRFMTVTPGTEPIQIVITGPEGGPVANPALNVARRSVPVVADLDQPGDELLLHDPNTGFDWIRLDASSGYSLADIESELAGNPLLTGFALASRRQVEQLIGNYLHAQGIRHIGLSGIPGGTGVNDALFEFIGLIGENSALGFGSSTTSTAGIVADKPGLNAQYPNNISVIEIKANLPGGSFGTFPRGVLASDRQTDHSNVSSTLGYWLVKAETDADTWLPAGRAYYLNDSLLIPSLDVEGMGYRAELNFRGSAGDILQLTELIELGTEAQDAVAHFDFSSGLLEIPLLRVVSGALGAGEDYALTLRQLADTVPPLFLIESAEPVPQD